MKEYYCRRCKEEFEFDTKNERGCELKCPKCEKRDMCMTKEGWVKTKDKWIKTENTLTQER